MLDRGVLPAIDECAHIFVFFGVLPVVFIQGQEEWHFAQHGVPVADTAKREVLRGLHNAMGLKWAIFTRKILSMMC